ncbi:MAG: MFS transporter, partial [Paracoccaceae bacterium]
MADVPKAVNRQSFLRIEGVPGLLGYSFVLTLARATTLPFMAVYLARVLNMELMQVGVTLSIVLSLGTVTSLCGGYLVDRVRSVVMLAGTAFASGGIFFLLPSIGGTFALIAWLSGLYAILAVSSIAVKATISQTVPAALRVPVFSLNYTLVNVGFAVGPLISVYVIASKVTLAFGVAAGFACLAAFIAVMFLPEPHKADDYTLELPSWRDTLQAVKGDTALALFTLGGLLSAVVYDQFSAYLSQYLLTQLSSEAAYQLIAQIVTANAVVVIATQFLLGRYINRRTLLMFVCIGTGCLVLGLYGLSACKLPRLWLTSMAIITIGEV